MSDRRKPFPFDEFEPTWQSRWDSENTYRTPGPGEDGFDASRPKFYVLDMFPYPSGSGLHVGHPEGYTATDILARARRMQGYNVLHPMGWDAFGLPAEQYAIKTGQHPRVTTEANVKNFRRQLKALGFSYDWSREVDTTDPGYVKWTQWIFLRLYNSYVDAESGRARPVSELEAKGWSKEQIDAVRLAFVAEVPVNWSPDLGTVLANEEVEEWRSKGHTVERRPLRQWMLRITAFAERLINDLDGLDWPEGIKIHQRNWIGRSEGAEVHFPVASAGESLTVFTTRPDTLFGATYMVLAPEHPMVDTITTPEQAEVVAAYRKACSSKSDLERTELAKEKSGVFTGATATNPVNGQEIPIWIADYVLMGYGTGAIMAVPGHDERDHEFARAFGLPIRQVVAPRPSGQELDALATAQNRAATGNRSKTVPVLPHGELPPFEDWENLDVSKGQQGLPHWQLEGATYAVVFRLADSMPADVREKLQEEKELLVARAARGEAVAGELAALSAKLQSILDQGLGSCVLRDESNARIVADALRHFDGTRYQLGAWCVMPNHVHAIVRPMEGHSLGDILHSWKSFTAHEIQKAIGGSGEVWQKDAFNRIIRDEKEWGQQSDYIARNPEEAGLKDWEWVGHGSLGQDRDGLATAMSEASPGNRSKTVPVLPAQAPHPAGQELDALATIEDAAFTDDGIAVNSGFLDGLGTSEAKEKMTLWLEAEGKGRRRVNYKLRDWLFSRQRYWGEPFPIVWENGNHRAIPESELPLLQPEMEDFRPTGDPRGPLARAVDWIRYSESAERETNTMPQWAGSCWYYLRYCDPRNKDAFISKEAETYWLTGSHGAVDLYVGGTEHAVLHLLYARFWHKVLHDLGYLSTTEPFQKLVNQGLILGEDGQKMSKSRGNVINPDDIVAEYGADSLRLFEMFLGPLQDAKPWSTKGVEGVNRFLARVWRVVMEEDQEGTWKVSRRVTDAPCEDKKANRLVHQTIRKVTEDIDRLAFNTAIPQLMVCNNDALMSGDTVSTEHLHIFLRLLNPFAPHLTEELNARLQAAFPSLPNGQLCQQSWPVWEPAALVVDEIDIIVQVNGKLRDKLTVAPDCPKDELEARALQAPKAKPHLEGLTIRKVIVVPGKLVNIVAN